MNEPNPETAWLERMAAHDPAAWQELLDRYEGRLLAFLTSRLGDRNRAEDLLQETLLGFLTALPHYTGETPIEQFLFAIAGHKLIDELRRVGRRPWLIGRGAVSDSTTGAGVPDEVPGIGRAASSLARSREQHGLEEQFLAAVVRQVTQVCLSRGDFERLKCLELLFVAGRTNQQVASQLGLSEQAVANHKQYLVQRLKAAWQRVGRSELPWSRLVGD